MLILSSAAAGTPGGYWGVPAADWPCDTPHGEYGPEHRATAGDTVYWIDGSGSKIPAGGNLFRKAPRDPS